MLHVICVSAERKLRDFSSLKMSQLPALIDKLSFSEMLKYKHILPLSKTILYIECQTLNVL